MNTAVGLVGSVLGQTLYLLLLAGAALSVLIGVLLLVDSARVLRWNGILNGWFSTRGALRALEEPRDVKRTVYRAHRFAGLLVVLGAVYALAALSSGFKGLPLARAFGDGSSGELVALMSETLQVFLIAGNIAALCAGAIVFFRPSLLKPLEAWADRVYRSRIPGEAVDKMRFQPDELAKAHPKLLGLLAAVGGAYVLLSLSVFYNA